MNTIGKDILKDVSRSFYLSIRVLPKAMRDPISLGYLLARASDTLADTETLGAEIRLEMLQGFRGILEGGSDPAWWERLSSDVISKQSHAGEKTLLQNMRGVFQWLESLDEKESDAIHRVMGHIIRGQILDVERFEFQDGFQMTSDDELDEYCYLVAGCVGAFWTEIGTYCVDGFSAANKEELLEWGINYGKGLQLINILRDLPSDLKNGRCYLPGADVADRDGLLERSARWRNIAREYLHDGERYALSLRHRRTRAATALPGLIGELTLDQMDNADWETLESGVKVPRWQVYHCAIQSILF